MKDLKHIRGRRYILDLIAEGEHETQDFKFAINDARKIARSISAFANNHGGHLLVGVKDNGTIAGVRNEEDIYVIEQAGERYCNPPIEIDFTAFSTGDTGIVIRARVEASDERPIKAQDEDGNWRAYYRVADENIAAHPLMVRTWQAQASAHARMRALESPAATAIMSAVRQEQMLPIEAALRLGPASRRALQEAIIDLAAMHVIDFSYIAPHGFVLVPGPDLAI